jgi:hypothetical protein
MQDGETEDSPAREHLLCDFVQLADGHTVVRLVLEPQHLAPCKAKCNQQLKNKTKTQK